MLTEEQVEKIIQSEVSFHTSRSGGKGGQNVNKVESKVELEFNLELSTALDEQQKTIIFRKYPSFVNENLIKIVSEKHRSQLENKEETQKKLIELLNKLLQPEKKRYATKPSRASRLKKLDSKKKNSEKKSLRQKPRDM